MDGRRGQRVTEEVWKGVTLRAASSMQYAVLLVFAWRDPLILDFLILPRPGQDKNTDKRFSFPSHFPAFFAV